MCILLALYVDGKKKKKKRGRESGATVDIGDNLIPSCRVSSDTKLARLLLLVASSAS